MKYIFRNGIKGLKKPSMPKLFEKVVGVYKDNRDEFEKTLKEGETVAETKSREDTFFQWLATQVSPILLSDLYTAFRELNEFCLEKKILIFPLFETTDISVLKQVRNTIEHDRIFRFTYRKHLAKLSSGIKQYINFIEKNSVSETRDVVDCIHVSSEIHDTEVDKIDRISKTVTDGSSLCIDFFNVGQLPFTNPLSFSYFEELHEDIGSWKALYTQVVNCLLDDYPETLFRYMNKNIGGSGRNDFADEYSHSFMTAPKKIRDGFYLETNLSATDIVDKIKHLLDICNVDYENLKITYTGKQSVETEIKVSVCGEKVLATNISQHRTQFIDWMRNRGTTQATILSYLSAIGACTKYAKESNLTNEDLFLISNLAELLRIKNALFAIPTVKQTNEQQHNRFLSALNKLITYRSTANYVDMNDEYISINRDDNSLSLKPEINELFNKYKNILEIHFSDNGYQTGRAIFRGRFKRFYNAEYGADPTESDERIDAILSKIGTMRGGRIFPKQDEEQRHFIDDIVADIVSALEEGVTGVYIDAVFTKYQQQLAEDLQVYNADALIPMLLASSKGRFSQRYSYFSKYGNNADSAKDILRIMKNFHEPQNYTSIHEKAWFIPYDKMKMLLVYDKSIVNVAAETYFYAPNLPVSSDELKQLISLIQTELQYRSHITDVEMMDIIKTRCPSIAINTENYTTYGLRNCLGYILRDQFSFKGPIISTVGKKISISDVYAEFARNHEVLHIDNFKLLSNEMNSSIYWESVLDEMVRISEQEMVRRDLIDFDVDVIDEVLEGMCPGDFMPLKDINLFLYFPNIGYQWNQYILESYLFKNSRKFKLMHASFGQSSVCGAMVRIDSSIEDYRTLIVDALARSNALDSIKAALQFIVDHGYQQRRRFDGIEVLMQEAKILKEQRENEEE